MIPVQKDNIVNFRTIIDSYINSIPHLQPSREIALVHTSLQRSFMWLGESLKELGGSTPYINSENPKNDIIEPTADHSNESLLTLLIRWQSLESVESTQTARVKDFRSVLEELIKSFSIYKAAIKFAYGDGFDDCLHQSFFALKESKMWLGWELARIKKSIDSQKSQQ